MTVTPKGWTKGNRAIARAIREAEAFACSMPDSTRASHQYHEARRLFGNEVMQGANIKDFEDPEIIREVVYGYFEYQYPHVLGEMQADEAEATKVIG
jgi:hypothetical protein